MTGDDGVVSVDRQGDVDLVRMSGEIDMANAATVEGEVLGQVTSDTALLLDLSAVSFIDSAGVRVVDNLVGHYEQRGLRVRIVVPETGPVRLVLRLCAFRDDLLQADLTGAVRELGG